jgi:hypothetical protein
MTQTTEHKKITPGDEEFWSERGIDFHVRLARPYVRYYPDDTTPVQDAYATLRTVGQKATMSRHAGQAAGILINRHAALPGLDPVPAEMRPDTATAICRRTGSITRGSTPTALRVSPIGGSTTAARTPRRSILTTIRQSTSSRRNQRRRRSRGSTTTTSHTDSRRIRRSAASIATQWRLTKGAGTTSTSTTAG